MIRVHHLNDSRSLRILWLLEELGLPYEIVAYQRDRRTMLAPESLRKIHPLGKSPVVEDDGRILAESGAIIEQMVDKYAPGKLAPERGTEACSRYLYFLHYAEGSAMPPLLLKLVLSKMGPLGWPALPYVNGQIKLHLDFLEGELKDRPYFCGSDFSGADIQVYFPLEGAAARGGLDGKWPRLTAFLSKMRERPAYRRATARGGELQLGR